MKPWLEYNMHLYWFDGDRGNYNYLYSVGITKIRYIADDIVKVRLCGFLPSDLNFLREFKNGDSLVVCHKEAGNPECYESQYTVAIINLCEIKNRWTENLSPNGYTEAIVSFYMSVKGFLVWQIEH